MSHEWETYYPASVFTTEAANGKLPTAPGGAHLLQLRIGRNRPQIPFGHRILAGRDERQEEQLFLNIRRQIQQVQNLRHAWLRDARKPSQLHLSRLSDRPRRMDGGGRSSNMERPSDTLRHQ